ncbi:MAG: hypothetical protein ACYCY2_11420 [Acidithiobacillus ferriphilus]
MRQKRKQLYAKAKQYHRNHSWRLSKDGILVRHDYTHTDPQGLSWWDDVGFIFGKRRIMVWWQHPRSVYQDRLESLAYDLCEKDRPEQRHDPLADFLPITQKAGRGLRKKITAYQMRPATAEYQDYLQKLRDTQAQQATVDHGWCIAPSVRHQALDWCQGIDLVLPVEVRNEADLLPLRDVALSVLRGDREALEAFPIYGFQDWMREQNKMREHDLHSHQVAGSC